MAEDQHRQTNPCQENSGVSTIDQQKSGNAGGPKTMWAEVVGMTPEEAEKKIEEDMPMAQFQVVPPNTFVTMDFNQRRIRLFLDASGNISRPPRIG